MNDIRTVAVDDLPQRRSLAASFLARVSDAPEGVALRAFDSDDCVTFEAWGERSRAVAGGLISLGVLPGDRVALLLTTCIEFHVADMGALLGGAVPFSLYVTSPVSQLREIVDNAEPRVLVTEAALLDKARQLVDVCPVIEWIVVVEESATRDEEIGLPSLEARCPSGFDVRSTAASLRSDDLCTLVYTSGTTGPPKGVQVRHGSIVACLDSIRQRFETSPDDRAIAYLPMAHVAERIFGHYAAFVYGYEVTSLSDPARLPAALREVRPTRFFGVPRIYEKVLAGLRRAMAESPERDRLAGALAGRLERVRAEQTGGVTSVHSLDDELDALRPLTSLTGLDQARFLAVAGAPSSPDMLEELTAFGLPVNEFYGSSEVGIVTCSPPGSVRLGTAGTALAGVQLRLDDDGEILIAGPTVTPGYLRDPVHTARVLDAEGWFRTGDIGRLDDGYLTIVDRKKALIINSAGKNMSPANIEQAIKGGQPLISQMLVVGDLRPYNVAIIVLDRDGVAVFANESGLGPAPFEELTRHPLVLAAVAAAVAAGNERLSRIEQIKRFEVLDHDWAPGGEQLTPTAKVRRREVLRQYGEAVERLYRGGAPSP